MALHQQTPGDLGVRRGPRRHERLPRGAVVPVAAMNLLKSLTVDTKAVEKEREEKCGARRRRPTLAQARARARLLS